MEKVTEKHMLGKKNVIGATYDAFQKGSTLFLFPRRNNQFYLGYFYHFEVLITVSQQNP